jgi:S1-C subfamily serine protease
MERKMSPTVLLVAAFVSWTAPQGPSNVDRLTLYNKIRSSTVKVFAEFGSARYHGTGVAVRSYASNPLRGFKVIVTNAHVIREGRAVSNKVTARPYKSERTLPAYVLFEHLNESLFYDIAFLVVPDPDDRIQVAQTIPAEEAYSWMNGSVYACGHPHDEEFLVDDGKVLRHGRKENAYVLEHDALIEQGNSGGGLFDAKGRLAAINTWLRQGNVGMAQDIRSFTHIFSIRHTQVSARVGEWQSESPQHYTPGANGLGPEAHPEGTSIFLLGVGLWRTSRDHAPHHATGTSDGSPKVVSEYAFGSLLVRMGSRVERLGRAHRGQNGSLVLYPDAAIGELKNAGGKIEFRVNDADVSDNSGEMDVFYLVMPPALPLTALRTASFFGASPR